MLLIFCTYKRIPTYKVTSSCYSLLPDLLKHLCHSKVADIYVITQLFVVVI